MRTTKKKKKKRKKGRPKSGIVRTKVNFWK